MLRILVLGDIFMKKEIFNEHLEKHLKEVDPELDFRLYDWSFELRHEPGLKIREFAGSPEEVAKLAKDVDILVVHLAPVTEEVLEIGKNIKVVACTRGGPVNVDIEAATKRRIPIIFTPGRNAETVAEYTIGLMLVESRNVIRAHMDLIKGMWREDYYYSYDVCGPELTGKTLGIIGFGAIGKRVAEIARVIGMNILVYDPYVPDEEVSKRGAKKVNLEDLLKNSDFVTIHARLTPETRGMISEKELKMMKPSAYLINTARGGIIDEKALIKALQEGWIKGAALDVFEEEPLSPDNPLLKLNNVTLTPHIAGASKDVAHRAAEMVAEDIKKVLKGERPKYCINPEVL